MRRIIVHDHPDRCVIGASGDLGDRTFFLQVRSGDRLTTVRIPKLHARLLGEKTDELLDEMIERDLVDADVAQLHDVLRDDEPLEHPIDVDLRAGSLGLGWNSATDLLIIEVFGPAEGEEPTPDLESDADDGPDTIRIRMSAAAGREFARRAVAVVAAGGPDCPFCQQPLEPEGHICPRANGYRR